MATRCQEQRPRKRCQEQRAMKRPRSPSISAGASPLLDGAGLMATAGLSIVITQQDSTLGWMEFARMRVCNSQIEEPTKGILIDDYKNKWQNCLAKVRNRSRRRLADLIRLFLLNWRLRRVRTDLGPDMQPFPSDTDDEPQMSTPAPSSPSESERDPDRPALEDAASSSSRLEEAVLYQPALHPTIMILGTPTQLRSLIILD